MNSNIRDYNLAAKLFLVLTVIMKLKELITEIMQLRINFILGASLVESITDISFTVLVIVFCILTILRYRVALMSLLLLYVLRFFLCMPVDAVMSMSYYCGQQFTLLMFDLGLFALAMCFKHNGISGWKSMIASRDYVMKHTNVSIKESTDSKSTIPVNETMVTALPNEEIQEKNVVVNTIVTTSTPQSGVLTKCVKCLLIPMSVILLFGVIGLSALALKSYPEYVESFKDKWRYTFGLPNNELAQRFYDRAITYQHRGDFLCLEGDDFILRNYNSFQNNIHNLSNETIYAVKDTIYNLACCTLNSQYAYLDNLSSINYHITIDSDHEDWTCDMWAEKSDKLYAAYPNVMVETTSKSKWKLINSEEVSAIVGNAKGIDSTMLLLRVAEYNVLENLRCEEEAIQFATQVQIDDIVLIQQLAQYYLEKGNITKAVDVYRNNISLNENSSQFNSSLASLLYLLCETEEAKRYSERAISINPSEVKALETLAKITADEKNWTDAKKYSRKAIDYGSQAADPYFIYSAASFELGDHYTAEDYYNRGYWIDPESPYVKRFEKYAGPPFEILYQEHAFTTKNNKVITDYGMKLYSYNSQYLSTRAKVKWHRKGFYTVHVKLFCKGKLETGESSISGYTYDDLIWNYTGKPCEDIHDVGGWGAATPGVWPSGNYRVEIWHQGELMNTSKFHIY